MKFHLQTLSLLLVITLLLLSPLPQASANLGANWLQFNFNPQHSGVNNSEAVINPANVSSLTTAFQVTLPAVADGAPVSLSSVATPQGTRNLLYLTTKNGFILALDANSGATIWSHQVGPGSCKINNGSDPCYTTSSPAIDPDLRYVYSYGLDGYVHKYQAGDGTEIRDAHWPELATLKPFDEKGSSALSTATARDGTSYLYAASAGYPGDKGDYQGHVTIINLATGTQKVFNAACSNQAVHFAKAPAAPNCSQVQTAVWARPGVVYDAELNRIFLSTGNGLFNPAIFGWGDSVLAINPDGSSANGSPLDSYTPTNHQSLDLNDLDIGSTSLVILPARPGTRYPHLAVQGGKDAMLRLINLDNMNGHGAPGSTGGEIGPLAPFQLGGEILSTPAVWTNPSNGEIWVFVTTSTGIAGFKVNFDGSGNPSLASIWSKLQGGTSPIVVNNILYYTGYTKISALDPTTGNQLWAATIGATHWESPILVNGMLYITDEASHLTAFTLNPAIFTNHLLLPKIAR